MNLNNFIADECANHRRGGACPGMPVLLKHDETGRAIPGQMFAAPKCRVAEGKRCDYFEKYVMPLAAKMGKPHIVDEYQNTTETMMLGSSARAHVKARLCGCGTPLAARQRTCEHCQAKKRLESARLRMARRRELPVRS